MKKVLISAPYMLRERAKIETMLKPYLGQWEITWAQVHERLEESDLLPIIGQYHGLLCGDDRMTAKVYDAAKNLKAVVKWGTGIDSIHQEEAVKRGIKVFRTPGAFTEPVADSTLALMLAFARGIALNDRVLKTGGWDKPQGWTLAEKSVGLIGFGDIGQAVAKRLQVFGAKVMAYDPAAQAILAKSPGIDSRLGVELVSRERVFTDSDFISLHCDLNPTSVRSLSSAAFETIERSGRKPWVINTARGPLIEEAALIRALERGVVAGAGLDVFEEEPLPLQSPLRKMQNVLLSSHNTNSSPRAWDRVHQNSIRMMAEGLA